MYPHFSHLLQVYIFTVHPPEEFLEWVKKVPSIILCVHSAYGFSDSEILLGIPSELINTLSLSEKSSESITSYPIQLNPKVSKELSEKTSLKLSSDDRKFHMLMLFQHQSQSSTPIQPP